MVQSYFSTLTLLQPSGYSQKAGFKNFSVKIGYTSLYKIQQFLMATAPHFLTCIFALDPWLKKRYRVTH